MRRLGVGAWSIIGLLILAYIALWILLRIRVIFPPLVLALLIIYLLNPVVTRLHQRGVPRAIGAVLSYVVILGTLTLLVFLAVPFVSDQIDTFREDWPEFRTEIVQTIERTTDRLQDSLGTEIDTTNVACLLGAEETGADTPTSAECDRVTREFRDEIGHQAGRLTEIGFGVLEALLVFIIAPLLALYLLIDLPHLQRDFLHLVPPAQRDEVADLGSKVGRAVGGFFRGQLLVALFVGVLTSLGFWLIDLPFWLVIGAVAGFTNLIPLVGPFIGGGLGLIVGILSEGAGLGLKAALVALVVQQIDNHIVSPNVMKRAVQLHPVTVMLSILAGGTVASFWGVLLAVPAVAVAKILFGHLWVTRVLAEDASPFVAAAPDADAPPVAPDHPDAPDPQDARERSEGDEPPGPR